MALTLGTAAGFSGAVPVKVFIGVGGVLQDVNADDNSASGSFVDDLVNTDSWHWPARLAQQPDAGDAEERRLATVTTDNKSYMGLDAHGPEREAIGIPGLTFGCTTARCGSTTRATPIPPPLCRRRKLTVGAYASGPDHGAWYWPVLDVATASIWRFRDRWRWTRSEMLIAKGSSSRCNSARLIDKGDDHAVGVGR
jgi:hypothetical protein